MKCMVKIFALLVTLCVLLSACDAWTGGEYLSVTPHEVQPEPYEDRVIEVNSYTQLRNAITNLVRTGAENGVISISAFNQGTIHFYVDTAISNVIENTPFGAYAVDKITYEIGTNRGTSVVACRIHYRQGRQLPNKISQVENLTQFNDLITKALDGAEEYVLVYTEQYEKQNIESFVAAYAAQYPDRVIEIPQVQVEIYPEKGAEKIIQVKFKYNMPSINLHQMRAKVEDVFRSAELRTSQLRDPESICEELYIYLTNYAEFRDISSAMPAYELLVQRMGDSYSFALVYARMCSRAGVECKMIAGERNGKSWYWNVVRIGRDEYHVDLLRCFENQEFQLKGPEQMSGYSWEK